jgi:hypothetical protein
MKQCAEVIGTHSIVITELTLNSMEQIPIMVTHLAKKSLPFVEAESL